MSLKDYFEQAVKDVRLFKTTPSEDELLTLYKYYKQATVGKCNIDRPTGLFDYKGKTKWDAWSSLKSMSKEDAMFKYCDFAILLKDKYY